jgi:hypothetical protein
VVTDGTTIVNINLPGAPGTLLEAITELKGLVVTNQEKIDAIGTALEGVSGQLNTALTGLTADFAALKQQITDANVPIDTSAVDEKVNRLRAAADALAALDAENPPKP